jgi:hypothetical protein
MRSLRRIAWIVAWLAWLGAGLVVYRELPRDLNLRAQLSIGDDALLGFLHNESLLVTYASDSQREHAAVHVWDARADLIATWPTPPKDSYSFSALNDCLIFDSWAEEARSPKSLNVRTGEWRTLGCPRIDARYAAYHDSRPWAAFLAPSADLWGELFAKHGKIVVVDLATGRLVAELPSKDGLPEGVTYPGPMWFIPGAESLLVEVYDENAKRSDLQLWRIPPGRQPEKAWLNVRVGDKPTMSAGRVAWHQLGGNPYSVDVFDVQRGTIVLAQPPRAERGKPFGLLVHGSGVWPGPVLSTDGRTVLQSMSGDVWDVDKGVKLTTFPMPKDYKETPYPRVNAHDQIEFSKRLEDSPRIAKWNEWIAPVLPMLQLQGELHSVYDLRTASLRYRCHRSTIPDQFRQSAVSSAEDLLVETDGSVYDLPPRIDWPKFAAIQSALAVPLIAVWLIGRLRRKAVSRRIPV